MSLNLENPVPQDFHLSALQPFVRPTSHRCMGPVISHSAGGGCLITNVIFVNVCPQRHSLSFDCSFYRLCY